MFTTPDGHVDGMVNVHSDDTAHERRPSYTVESWNRLRQQYREQDERDKAARRASGPAILQIRAGVIR